MERSTSPPSSQAAPRRSLRDTLDLLVALSAMVTSLVGIWLAVSQGDDMEKLVQAQSWPYVGFHSGNSSVNPATDERISSLSFSVTNLGVGPAKLRTFEVLVDDTPVRFHDSLIAAAAGKPEPLPVAAQTQSIAVAGRVLRAGDSITYLRWDRPDDPVLLEYWNKLDKARFGRLVMRACFCSVFDECWVSRSDETDAHRIDQCPAVRVGYIE